MRTLQKFIYVTHAMKNRYDYKEITLVILL